MAVFTFTNAYLTVNGVDLSDHVKKLTVEDNREPVDFTAMGATSKVYGKGLGDAKITVEFFQDFAAGKVYATCAPLIASTTPVTVEARPVNGARSATNPGMVMSALLFTFTPLDGTVGEATMYTAEFTNGSQTGITYPTS